MADIVQANTEQEKAEKQKKCQGKSKLNFCVGSVCLSVGGVCFCCLKTEMFWEK